MNIGLIGVLVAIICLMYFSYKGYSPILMAPICSLIVCVTAGISAQEGILTNFAQGFGNMVAGVAFTFICSSIFGKIMMKTKAAYSLAYWIGDTVGYQHAPTAIIIISAVLAYGGMAFAGFIIAFPIAMVLCSKANYSKGIIMGMILGGSWTFAMTGPFAPTNHNYLCMKFLGTTAAAGLVPGLVAGVGQFVLCCLYGEWQAKKWQKEGKVFAAWDEVPQDNEEERKTFPHPIIGLIPIVAVVLIFNLTSLQLPTAMTIGCLIAIALQFNKFSPKEWLKICDEGAREGIMPMINLAIMAGIGGVVSATSFYGTAVEFLASTTSVNPYILAFVAGNVMAFCMGSASSALATVLPAFTPIFENFLAKGYNMGNFHRLLCIGTGGLDSLPHAGGIISMNALYKTNHKESYFPVFICCTVIPMLTGVVAVLLAVMGLH